MIGLAALALVAALHSPSETVRAHALRPLLLREAREHRLPFRLVAAVAYRESTYRTWHLGDHGKASGLFQVHGDAIPGHFYARAELLRPDVNAHVACLRLVLARKRCGGGPKHYAANFNGRACGAQVYAMGDL